MAFRWPFSRDFNELVFRCLFSSIFLGLGGEHIFADQMIQKLMPLWIPSPRLFSILAGCILLIGGMMVLIGYRIHIAAYILGSFLVIVTALVHLPAVILPPAANHPSDEWMWIVLQRSNLVKNMCLLGVCFQLGYHRLGIYSFDGRPKDQSTHP